MVSRCDSGWSGQVLARRTELGFVMHTKRDPSLVRRREYRIDGARTNADGRRVWCATRASPVTTMTEQGALRLSRWIG